MSGNALYWVTTAVLALHLVLGGVWGRPKGTAGSRNHRSLRLPTDHLIISVPLAARRVVRTIAVASGQCESATNKCLSTVRTPKNGND